MTQQSDAVQHTATAYAEREVLAACCRQVAAPGLSPEARSVLESVVRLYALHRLEQVKRGGGGRGGFASCGGSLQLHVVRQRKRPVLHTASTSFSHPLSTLHPPRRTSPGS